MDTFVAKVVVIHCTLLHANLKMLVGTLTRHATTERTGSLMSEFVIRVKCVAIIVVRILDTCFALMKAIPESANELTPSVSCTPKAHQTQM